MTSPSPRRNAKPLQWLLVLAAMGGTAWFLSTRSSAKPVTSKSQQSDPVNVTYSLPVVKKIVEWDDFIGRLEAIDSVDVRSRVSGYLTSTHFEDGQLIKAGDLLAVVDQRPFIAEVARTRGDLAEADGKLQQAKAAILQANAESDRAVSHQELTKKQLERNRTLRVQGAVSQEDLDVAEAAALAADADRQVAQSKIAAANSNLIAAEAAVEVARANLQLADLNLSFTEVRAPIDGRISRRYVTEGNMISGGSSESTLLTNIVSLNPIHCYFDADERKYLDYMRMDKDGERKSSREARNPVFLSLADDKDIYPYKGHMDFVDNRIDRSTGTIRGRAIISNDSLALTPGMFARVRLPGSAPHNCILIPDKAVGTDQNEKFVLIVQDHKVERRLVQLGPISHGLRIVRSGLEGNEQIIVSGLQKVKTGSLVNAVEEVVKVSEQALPDDYQPIPLEQSLTPKRRPAGNVFLPVPATAIPVASQPSVASQPIVASQSTGASQPIDATSAQPIVSQSPATTTLPTN